MHSSQRKPLSTSPQTDQGPLTLLDRDHSILAFNTRVLDWAVRDDVPLTFSMSTMLTPSNQKRMAEFFAKALS